LHIEEHVFRQAVARFLLKTIDPIFVCLVEMIMDKTNCGVPVAPNLIVCKCISGKV
jgi:hypothetical protein